jgi:hypothetical protein
LCTAAANALEAAEVRVEKLEGALQKLLNVLSMGPLEVAASFGPDVDGDDLIEHAANHAITTLEDKQ